MRAKEARNLAEEEAQRRVKEEAARRLAEEKAERLARELEEAQLRVEEARQRAEEETRKHAEEESARWRAEEEAVRLAGEVADAQRRVIEVRQRAEREADADGENERSGVATHSYASLQTRDSEAVSQLRNSYDTRQIFEADLRENDDQFKTVPPLMQSAGPVASGASQRKKIFSRALFAVVITLVITVGGYAIYRQLSVPLVPPTDQSPVVIKTLPATVNADMIPIPGGTFMMGRKNKPSTSEENNTQWPAHQVTIQPFLIDRTEVTNAKYADFVNKTGYDRPKGWSENGPAPDKKTTL